MTIFTAKLLKHEFCMEKLRKIGAKVINMEGIMFHVKYDKNDLNIEYLYHLNPDNTYLLERIKPHTLHIGEYKTEEDLVEIIMVDIEQLLNAKNSHNFDRFISIDKSLSKIVRHFDDLFLYYNVDKEDMLILENETLVLKNKIMEIKERSRRIYHKKDPDSFNSEK